MGSAPAGDRRRPGSHRRRRSWSTRSGVGSHTGLASLRRRRERRAPAEVVSRRAGAGHRLPLRGFRTPTARGGRRRDAGHREQRGSSGNLAAVRRRIRSARRARARRQDGTRRSFARTTRGGAPLRPDANVGPMRGANRRGIWGGAGRTSESMRAVVVLACGFMLAGSPVMGAPLPRPTPATEHPIRTIALVLTVERLSTDPPPQVIEGRLLLPLRTIFDALGIPLARAGDSISAHVPLGTVVVTFGSENALVNDRPASLGSRVQEIDGITYVPLTFLTVALGATANYDQRGARVQILSAFIGRTLGPEERRADGGTLLNGVVSAIDNNSAPPSITVTSGRDLPRTIAITSDAIIYVGTSRCILRGNRRSATSTSAISLPLCWPKTAASSRSAISIAPTTERSRRSRRSRSSCNMR